MSGKPKYPKEVYDFIKENYGEYGLALLPVINEKFGIEMTRDYLLRHAYMVLHLKSYKVPEENYTEEEKEWIKENRLLYKSTKELCDAFNNKFTRIHRTSNSMRAQLERIGVTMEIKGTKAEVEWLRKNAPFYPLKTLVDMHNSVFTRQRTKASLGSIASTHGIKLFSDKDAYFDYTQNNNSKVAEVGHIRLEKGDEYIKVAKSSSDNKIARKDMWIKRTRYEYEKAYGVKPKKWECVIQLDGDKTNYAKENLYLVPNYINGYILQYLGKLIKDQPELNKAHILRFEVEKAIKDYEKKNKNFKEWRKNMNEYDPVNEGGKE